MVKTKAPPTLDTERYPTLLRALRNGEITRSHKPLPNNRTLRTIDLDDEALDEGQQFAPHELDASARTPQRDRLRELRSELIAEGAEPGHHLPELERRASTWPATPGRRRDFVLDSGAFLSFSLNPNLLVDYIDLLDRTFDGSFWIPSGALVEVYTGEPPRDAFIRRLVDAIMGEAEDGYLPLSIELAKRAGALLYQVRQSNAPFNPVDGPIDAQIVAVTEDLSAHTAVTILTTDPDEIGALVGVTGRTNITVDVPG